MDKKSYLFILVLFFASCDSEIKSKVCQCEGQLVSFKNYRGMVAQVRNLNSTTSDFMIVSDQLGYVSACPGLADEMKIDGQKVVFSGKYINNCQTPITSYGVTTMNVQLTDLQKSDTIFTAGPLKIEIFRSEDYGYPVGFGYFIDYQNRVKIGQHTIPGIGNNITFKTSKDAYKIALRVGYRLNTSKDFPSTPYTDLYFLKIVN